MEQMLQKMMRRFPLFIAMGFMIVVISLIIGAVNAGRAFDYYSAAKTARDTSSELAHTRASVESIVVWLPYFKFLGLSMILSGITMALGIIATKLQNLGKAVMNSVPQNARVAIPPRPSTVMAMRGFMMLGMMIIVVGFIVAIGTAGVASDVYTNTVEVLDSLDSSSPVLQDLARVHSTESWLDALKFVGVAVHFLGIINGLATIIFVLQYQKKAFPEVVEKLPPNLGVAPAAGD
jgi:hypothetical protein